MSSTTTVRAERLTKLIAIRANDSGELPSEVELLQTGMWDTPYHGMFMVQESDIDQYIENFSNNVRPSSSTTGLPIDEEHDAGAATGWIKSLFKRPNANGGQSLWGNVEWTTLGESLLKGGVYKFFSPEFWPYGYTDPEGIADPCDNVLIGGGLTNRPLFKGLTPVMASDGSRTRVSGNDETDDSKVYIKVKENSMNLNELRTKQAADLSDDEKKFLADHSAELTQDEKVALGFEQPTPAPAPAPAAPVTPSPEEPVQPTQANDGKSVSITASELEALKSQAARGVAADDRLRKIEASDKITALCFSDESGYKFKADQKDNLVSFYLTCDDKQKTAFESLLKEMPAALKASDFAPKGRNSTEDQIESARIALTEKAAAIVKASDGKTSFSAALEQARSENANLAAQEKAEK